MGAHGSRLSTGQTVQSLIALRTGTAGYEEWRNPALTCRIPELDGLRGLAILLVLIEHYIVDASHLHVTRWQAYALVPFRLTWSGVDLFFVLSGFLIGGILIDAKGSENYYSTFYCRRFYRILPLYFSWFFLFLVGLYLSGTAHADLLRRIFNRDLPLWSYALFIQNVAMSMRGTIGPMWLGITWSLAVEEQFYLLLPLAVRKLSTKGILQLACGAIIIAPALRMMIVHLGGTPLPPYVLLPCRADALGWGVLIAVIVRNRAAWSWVASCRAYIYAASLVLGFTVCLLTKLPFASALFMGVGFSLLAAFYALLLMLVVVNPGRIERTAFGWTPLRRLGIVAYAVYMCHAGISFMVHGSILAREPRFDDWSSVSVTLLSLFTVFLVALISWRVMEQPLIRRSHSKYAYRPSIKEGVPQPLAVSCLSGCFR
jgi:peptidoglycan/LPS O-acetylase OafA/YrhL